VVGYTASGWLPEDTIVVENTGFMDANEEGKLKVRMGEKVGGLCAFWHMTG
jgi:hypothetical protein